MARTYTVLAIARRHPRLFDFPTCPKEGLTMTKLESVTVANGKYTLINQNGRLTALRYGEPWDVDLTGNNLVYWLMVELIAARETRDELLQALIRSKDVIESLDYPVDTSITKAIAKANGSTT